MEFLRLLWVESQWRLSIGAHLSQCRATCRAIGFDFAGLEFGMECWCGALASPAVLVGEDPRLTAFPPVSTGNFCNLPCKGNSAERCGGSDRIDVYQFNPNSVQATAASFGNNLLQGCFLVKNVPPSSSIGSPLWNVVSVDVLSVEACGDACLAQRSLFSAVAFGNICLCDSALNVGAADTGQVTCPTGPLPCPGNAAERCGTSITAVVYKHQNINGVWQSFSTIQPAANSLVGLIQNAAADNVASVGPVNQFTDLFHALYLTI
ncbi:hypothetical protein M422DRAFT_41770 [Sphaerobolus stellatus SS14]|nr:hypothetical protein M422DRAFT_41770 [Sphaerobolus stellatus SS14]